MTINKNSKSQITALLLVLILCLGILGGCISRDNNETAQRPDSEPGQESAGEPVVEPPGADVIKDEENFDLFMDEVFADWVSADTLSMNFYLADPYVLSIERPEPTYGKVLSQELIEESKQETREILERLDGFDYNALRDDQQLVYDIIRRNNEISLILEQSDDFFYYTSAIRPLNGIQVQLPILLAEFRFYTEEDIGRYLDLLEDTFRYFSELVEVERERSRRGFFMSDANVDSVLEQIDSFLEKRDDNLLITVFNDKIDSYEGLSNEQRESFKQRNKELVLDNVLAAYDYLMEAMKELRGVGVNTGGLAALPNGTVVAHARLRLRIGTDKSAQELEMSFVDWLNATHTSLMSKLHGIPEINEKFMNGTLGEIDDGTPKSYIADLRKKTALDFPPIGETGLNVLEVHENLQEHMSPAFYLTPAIDRFNENVVYINPPSLGDNLFLFTVLAHEAYPGHMYQTVYFLQQSPHPIRTMLSNVGYSEAWATYAEMTSYFYAGLDYDEAELMWEMRLFDMLLAGYTDLAINVFGWNHDDLANFLESINIINPATVNSFYNRATGVPLMQMTYSLGFIELIEMIEEMHEIKGNSFELMDFYKFYLETGSAPFNIMRSRM